MRAIVSCPSKTIADHDDPSRFVAASALRASGPAGFEPPGIEPLKCFNPL